jgi:hypothetical protein
MKCSIYAVILILLGVSVCAQDAATERAGHGRCAEDREPVGYPLKGWVGYTDTGKSVSDMTVQALTSLDKPPAATVKTDTAGRFSFLTLSPGRYYLRAAKMIGGAKIIADDIVTVSKGKSGIACLVAEATGQSPR